MIFTVQRASSFFKPEIKPIEEAYLSKHKSNDSDEYLDAWTINIDTIHGIMELIKAYGKIVIRPNGFYTQTPQIEIYDDYIE